MFSVSFLSKRSIISVAAMGVLAITTSGTARADRTLSIDEALQVAHQNNRDLQQAKARVEQAHAAVQQAWSALLPTVSAQGKYTHNYREVALTIPGAPDIVIQKGEQLDFAANATVPLIVPWAYPSLQAARRNEEAGRATQEP